MLRLAGRGILIGFALAACVTCIKARQAQSPTGLVRELQRNLSMVNVAAVRRRRMPQQPSRAPVRRGTVNQQYAGKVERSVACEL